MLEWQLHVTSRVCLCCSTRTTAGLLLLLTRMASREALCWRALALRLVAQAAAAAAETPHRTCTIGFIFARRCGIAARRLARTRSSTSSLSAHEDWDATGRTGSQIPSALLLLLLLLRAALSLNSSPILALQIHLSNAHIGAESSPLLRHMLTRLALHYAGGNWHTLERENAAN
jgi:hypothetical protein